ncbi:DUF6588 family protein [Tenacibaculum amylolyticum]|uniref:DUF6588 family protein n=1 Tax=Tenacibaculum amylolyticum TaxID=104269 RepID=UPI003894F306
MKRLTLILLLTFSINSTSQELETILLAGEDAQKLMSAYLAPGPKGLIYSMNNGWYHTAKVHKKLGFDITIGLNASFIPESDETFNIQNVGLSSATFNQNTTPTFAGSENITPATITYQTTINGLPVTANFQMPTGVKEDFPIRSIPAPVIQTGLGLPYKFEVMVRFLPTINIDDTKAGLYGFGLKKEITDWFGIVDKTPLHVSLLAAYTNMNVTHEIGNVTGDVATQNASAEYNVNAYTFQAIASFNLPIINFFGGVGYNTGNSSLALLGDYSLNYQVDSSSAIIQETVSDPFSIDNNAGSFNATVGARLSLGFFKIFGSYTAQEYSSVNAGIAFSFR